MEVGGGGEGVGVFIGCLGVCNTCFFGETFVGFVFGALGFELLIAFVMVKTLL